MSQQSFDHLCAHARETALLQSIAELLGWDERTKMPPAAGAYRAEQMTYLSSLVHRRHTDPQVGEWLEELATSVLAKDPYSDAGATIRQMRREYDKLTKLPQSLVEELTRASVLGQQAWVEARKNDDFATFAPILEKIVTLKRQQADAIGYTDCPYDALLDDFEPGETTKNVARILEGLRSELVPLVAAIADSTQKPDLDLFKRHYPIDAQEVFGKQAATAIGFEFNRGRLDVTHHPFCAGMGPDDCRLTTRYDEHFFPSGFFSILHEAGHGIYDQGLRGDQFGLPPGTYVSLGIHESQSRMWENLVGRSIPFWRHFFPLAQQAFPEALRSARLEDFCFAANDVRPSLIRVEADEATYNLHIIIRFELEQALINEGLAVKDLPAAWNQKYRDYLGIEPPSDANGVLQDVHWSAALIGYFPTYALGNLYAAQFFAQAAKDVGPLDEQFERGEFTGLLGWLREKIHQQGQRYTARELVEKVTGKPLSHDALINYLREKYTGYYGID
ncbi:MAG: carboxypeptidase M32 [Planctomycetaceae bacterium]|nr:carboxypeptidase M32 [Planctomycetales bacterium]MCB9874191.1 carboxypeptidase M32 [Planctomycetaceae bacterium]MCB9940828.1 carboxypeptidase M32 [Planctomycetaceae bacterium]